MGNTLYSYQPSRFSVLELCVRKQNNNLFLRISPSYVKLFYKQKGYDTEVITNIYFNNQLLFAPLTYVNTLKYFFTQNFQTPVKASETEMATATPFKKLSLLKLAENNFDQKEGPIVIFFEVIKHQFF